MRKELIKPSIFLIASLTACVFLVVNLFAWFAVPTTPSINSVELSVTEGSDNSFAIISINNDKVDGGYKKPIWPNDTWSFEIRTLKDNSDFSINLHGGKLNYNDFANAVGKTGPDDREDLLLGPYEKIETLNDDIEGNTTVNSYREFDIDKFLNTRLRGIEGAKTARQYKIEFLKMFADNNNIASAFSVKIVKINDTVLVEPIPLVRPLAGGVEDETSTELFPDADAVKAYYGDPGKSTLVLAKDDVVYVEVTYGARMMGSAPWMPAINIMPEAAEPDDGTEPDEPVAADTTLAGIFGKSAFRSKGLNCFIGQVVEITFDVIARQEG